MKHPLPALVKWWPEEARDEWAERAAILEFDARMERSRAERAAEHIVRERWEQMVANAPPDGPTAQGQVLPRSKETA